jgi:hypothetical protein
MGACHTLLHGQVRVLVAKQPACVQRHQHHVFRRSTAGKRIASDPQLLALLQAVTLRCMKNASSLPAARRSAGEVGTRIMSSEGPLPACCDMGMSTTLPAASAFMRSMKCSGQLHSKRTSSKSRSRLRVSRDHAPGDGSRSSPSQSSLSGGCSPCASPYTVVVTLNPAPCHLSDTF